VLSRQSPRFSDQLSPFVGVRDRSTGRFASVNGGVRIGLDLGLRIWKAGWVQALAGSNPASSANLKQALTCGNAVRITSGPGTASPQTSRRPVSVSGRRLPKSGLPRSRSVRRRSLTYASPDQLATKAGWSTPSRFSNPASSPWGHHTSPRPVLRTRLTHVAGLDGSAWRTCLITPDRSCITVILVTVPTCSS
jgi:hypothetical protein